MSTQPSNNRKQIHLLDLLSSGRGKFTLFLGAGASVSSGVHSAKHMIREWRERLLQERKDTNQSEEDFWNSIPWYNTDEEYSNLFEAVYDEPSQRREYIEECIAKATPSWGYIYLVNLIRKGVFQTIFTTNFDDLINESCYLFSTEVRPLVCAHDSSVRSIRITSSRPKVIKLHGDFLFDNIKNTLSELETLEENIRDKFKQFAAEFGIVVIGYSGADRSVMDALHLLLQNPHNFPFGVYWCVRKGSNLPKKAARLLKFPKFHCIEIEGFDEFFAELHSKMGHDLQPELADPYGALAKRLNQLLRKVPDNCKIHPIIEKDISDMSRKMSSVRGNYEMKNGHPVVRVDLGKTEVRFELPFGFLARVRDSEGHASDAMDLIIKQLRQDANQEDFAFAFKLAKKLNYDRARMDELFDILEQTKFTESSGELNGSAVDLIAACQYDAASRVLDVEQAILERFPDKGSSARLDTNFINKLQIKRHRKQELEPHEKEGLIRILQNGNSLYAYCCHVLLENTQAAEAELAKMSPAERSLALTWPISKLLPDLQQLKKIAYGGSEKIIEC